MLQSSVTGNGELEIIVPEYNTSIRWIKHGYPCSLTKWHYHPELEFHLIRKSTGIMLAGDGLVPFEPGQVALIGSNIPHHWISDIGSGEFIEGRDIACQVHPSKLAALTGAFPEAAPIHSVLHRADHVLLLQGGSAQCAAEILESMCIHSSLQRLIDVVELLQCYAMAPDGEWKTVVTPSYSPDFSGDVSGRINVALNYIKKNIAEEISLEGVAEEVVMNPEAFSRFFHKMAGISFSDLVSRLRISHACRLLTSTDWPISFVREGSGYRNASNFNRRFLGEIGMTPSEYRRAYRKGTA